MIKKIAIMASFFAVSIAIIFGQNSPTPLQILSVNVDTRSAGIGDVTMGEAKGMYLYTNPTSIFQTDTRLYTSYTFGAYPRINNNRQVYHAVSTGYKILNKHAIMVGFRYMGGLVAPAMDEDLVEWKSNSPKDWTLDLGYALNFNDNFSAYLSGKFIQTYLSRVAYTGGASIGVYYRNGLPVSNTDVGYTVGLSVDNVGGTFKYAKDGAINNMPASVGLGGSILCPFSDNHKLNAALSTRYFLLPAEARAFMGGIGLEYELFETASLRTGYHWGSNNKYLTFGAGLHIKYVNIDLAYMLSREKTYNVLNLGMSVQF